MIFSKNRAGPAKRGGARKAGFVWRRRRGQSQPLIFAESPLSRHNLDMKKPQPRGKSRQRIGQALMSRAQSRQLDRQAACQGLTGGALMERAGARAARWISDKYPKARLFSALCGPGNNGGDGWAAARHLKSLGRRAAVYAPDSGSPLFQLQKQKAAEAKVPQKKWDEWQPSQGEVLIDAVFGAGLNRNIEGEALSLISRIRESRRPVASLDLPSGICADTGQVFGAAVRARHTLAFALEKPGLRLRLGPAHAGGIVRIPLGFPKKLLDQVCGRFFLVSKKDAAAFLPSFPPTANKSHRGRTLIAAGRKGMWGCGLLACRGAFTVGSGYVSWAGCGSESASENGDKNRGGKTAGQSESEYPYEGAWASPEILTARLNDPDLFKKQTAAAAGPGLGFGRQAMRFLLRLQKQNIPLVLDADALTLIARAGRAPAKEGKSGSGPGRRGRNIFKESPEEPGGKPGAAKKTGQGKGRISPRAFPGFAGPNRLMTPHSGELSRLLGLPSKEIDSHPLRFAEKGAKAMGCWLLLKGFHSVLSDGEKSYIINSGSSALGKAGTGDVLTGMAAGLLAQGLPLPEAALLAAALHGETADRWLRGGRDINAFSASALLDELPFAMAKARLYAARS